MGGLCLVRVLLVAYLVVVVSETQRAYWTWLDGWGLDALEILVSALCIGRALLRRPGRLARSHLGYLDQCVGRSEISH